MSQAFKKKKEQPVTKKNHKDSSSKEDDYIHLQTILMMTQLNTTYYKLELHLTKAFGGLKNQYRKVKLNAFLKIQHFRPDSLDIKAFAEEIKTVQRRRQKALIEDELDLELIDAEHQKMKKNNRVRDEGEVCCRLAVECRMHLTGLIGKVEQKRKLFLSWGLQSLILHAESTSIRILSGKSSKIETNDSHKSKVFKRSVERNPNRKSFSMEKSGLPSKHDYYVPVKFQPSKQQTPITKSEQHIAEYTNTSVFSKFLQDRGQVSSRQRKTSSTIAKDKNLVKVSSYKKLSMSMMGGQKQMKIRELQTLKTKYKKLMDEFNWFSQRFKKVIEEEDEIE